jgi:cytochrome P450
MFFKRYKDARKDHLPYLWAVIMEVMRLLPAVPGGLPRVTPKGGEIIAGKFIPEGVSDILLGTMVTQTLIIFIDCC